MSDIDLKCVANNDVQITVTLTRADGAAVNLTGATIKFSVVDQLTGQVKFSKTTGGGGVSVSSPATAGIFVVTIDKEDIDDFHGTYIYEAVITDSSGNVGTMTDSNNEAGLLTIRRQWATP